MCARRFFVVVVFSNLHVNIPKLFYTGPSLGHILKLNVKAEPFDITYMSWATSWST